MASRLSHDKTFGLLSKCCFRQYVCSPFDRVAVLENLAVDVNVPLSGGKVRGSLARAGLVRGQTRKVEAG
jgi:hypothetical protein